MALVGRTQIGLRATTNTATVPNDPKALLMYYLNCMCTVLKLDDDADISRLRKYRNYRNLSDEDTDLLILICGVALKPDVLLNKCIFHNEAMCVKYDNEFYEIEAVSDRLLVAGNVVVGGRTKRVSKIMTFKVDTI